MEKYIDAHYSLELPEGKQFLNWLHDLYSLSLSLCVKQLYPSNEKALNSLESTSDLFFFKG